MATRVVRKNESLLRWVRAVGMAVLTYAALAGMRIEPGWAAVALALAAGLLAVIAVDLGLLAALFALSLPIVSANVVVGITLLVVAVVSVRYLGADGGQVLFVVAASAAAAFFGPVYPVWIAVGLAGSLMGIGEGAIAAAVACVFVEVIGLSAGHPSLGPTITGGSAASMLLDFSSSPASIMQFAWLKGAFGSLRPDSVNAAISAISSARETTALIVQPLIWGGGAALAGLLARSPLMDKNRPFRILSPAAGALATGIGLSVLLPLFGSRLPLGMAVIAGVSSAAGAAAFAWLLDAAFPLHVVRDVDVRHSSMAAEDADVDELLRLIATAEDKLSSEHTSQRVVMITDMKSFSRMTEEDGSMLTAKAIQAHRDLLLPVIEKFGGHGKSTGGDGLVAAFEDPARALQAAAEMQRVLAEYNTAHPDKRDMTVRTGIADGEVVLDRNGRPFIGAALNLAARVMNLGDGGQALVTTAVALRAKDAVRTHPHGSFDLKNIAKPVDVTEILWYSEQQPADPRTRVAV